MRRLATLEGSCGALRGANVAIHQPDRQGFAANCRKFVGSYSDPVSVWVATALRLRLRCVPVLLPIE
jgi:hypothetical protein